MTTKIGPVHELQLGKIKAAFWGNPVHRPMRYDVTFARIYKDDNGWKNSAIFGREDLLVLAKVSDMALNCICEQGQKVLFTRRGPPEESPSLVDSPPVPAVAALCRASLRAKARRCERRLEAFGG